MTQTTVWNFTSNEDRNICLPEVKCKYRYMKRNSYGRNNDTVWGMLSHWPLTVSEAVVHSRKSALTSIRPCLLTSLLTLSACLQLTWTPALGRSSFFPPQLPSLLPRGDHIWSEEMTPYINGEWYVNFQFCAKNSAWYSTVQATKEEHERGRTAQRITPWTLKTLINVLSLTLHPRTVRSLIADGPAQAEREQKS